MLAATLLALPAAAADVPADDLAFFESEVRPLLVERCYACHAAGAERIEGGLRLDSLAAHLRGGDSGPAIVPGDADASLLIEAVRYDGYEMPPSGRLPPEEIAVFEQWVERGAPWPDEPGPEESTPDDASPEAFDLAARKASFWLWQPIADPKPPAVDDDAWPRGAIDRFILAKLEAAGLQPAVEADRATLIRRLSFDLIGLPPTPDEVAAFVADDQPGATARVVDRLLASPHFGERWGRHWLDLMRYAESRGHEFDNDTPNAFQYRDYVIRALNADVPYDRFVAEHIAGDLLDEPRLGVDGGNESVLGTGFWHLGEWVHSPVDTRKDETDRFDDMIDTMSKAMLGLTVACARCHDHKFDAVSTADYYALSGFLQSSDYRQVRFESIAANGRVAAELARVDREHRDRLAAVLAESGVTRPQPRRVDHPAIAVDYADPSAFRQDGYLFGPAALQPGQATLTRSGRPEIALHAAAATDPIWFGLESVTEGKIQDRSALAKLSKSGRTLRTPTFELTDGRVSCRVEGAGHVVACVDSHRLISGPLHKQTIVPIRSGKRWVTLDLSDYVGHRIHLEFVPTPRQSLAVRLVAEGLDDAGRTALTAQLDAIDAPLRRYAREATPILGSPRGRQIVADWKAARDTLAARIVRRSRLAPAMLDGPGEDDRILIRGHSGRPGEIEPRHFLTALAGDEPMPIAAGSGRAELAACITDPTNPLTSRVIVNRLWHHLMGRGLVPTTDDFGVLGERPTHPDLLDHLARRFLADSRSLKATIRAIALSRTYAMGGRADPEAVAADPTNRLWHHRPPRRLSGEAIRDALLLLAGRLDPTLHGPSVPIHLTPFMDGRGRPAKSGPLDGDGRRSVYVAVRRNFLSPMMLAFDTPTPSHAVGRRTVSNVPAQALILLNDPLVAELSAAWGRRSSSSAAASWPHRRGLDPPGGRAGSTLTRQTARRPAPRDGAAPRTQAPTTQTLTTQARIDWLYRTALARPPSEAERTAAAAFVAGSPDDRVWEELAHALVNTKEFVFVR